MFTFVCQHRYFSQICCWSYSRSPWPPFKFSPSIHVALEYSSYLKRLINVKENQTFVKSYRFNNPKAKFSYSHFGRKGLPLPLSEAMTLSSLTSLNALEGKQIGSKNVVMIVESLTVNQVENCSVATHQIVKIVKKRSTVSQRSNFPPFWTQCGLGTRLIPLATRLPAPTLGSRLVYSKNTSNNKNKGAYLFYFFFFNNPDEKHFLLSCTPVGTCVPGYA